MITLNEHLRTSMLNESIRGIDGDEKQAIGDWITDHYIIEKGRLKKVTLGNSDLIEGVVNILKQPGSNGKYIANSRVDVIFDSRENRGVTSLTNDLFKWGTIGRNFDCSYSDIESLDGAPEKVAGSFYCDSCRKLRTLDGAPEKVECNFHCNNCDSLKSLEGAPEEVGRDFTCNGCRSLTSLKGAPKVVNGVLECKHLSSLRSLDGAPEEIGSYIELEDCPNLRSLNGLPTKNKIQIHYCKCPNLVITDEDRKNFDIFQPDWDRR